VPILQINFHLNISGEEYSASCESFAPAIAAVPGLRWKIWIQE